MDDQLIVDSPLFLDYIKAETEALGFSMASDYQTGSLLRTLAASKPAGHFLEIGTGTGLATAWILAGMDSRSHLTTVDIDEQVLAVARKYLGSDSRISIVIDDATGFLLECEVESFDYIFADSWPGKYDRLEETLGLLRPGGIFIIDDMLPQPNWPQGHGANVERLVGKLESREDVSVTKIGWSTGLMLVVKRP